MLLGRTGIWKLQAAPSTVQSLLKFLSDHKLITLRSTPLWAAERSHATEQGRCMAPSMTKGRTSTE